jgi:uncharacterized protein (TIGR00369 family)
MLERSIQKPLLKSVNKINPLGLRLQFKLEDNTARTEFTLNERHQGASGYVHEGVIALLMDEGMGWISRHGAGVKSVTGKLEIEFHNRARIGQTLVMTVEIAKNTRRLIEVIVRIQQQDGLLIATGHCLQFVIDSNPDG